jgi:chaperone required for assembly of F1-ATPase
MIRRLKYTPSFIDLAAFERAVYTTKSFLIALALVEGRITVEQASLASQVEVDSQIDIWGEVEDSKSSFAYLAAFRAVSLFFFCGLARVVP